MTEITWCEGGGGALLEGHITLNKPSPSVAADRFTWVTGSTGSMKVCRLRMRQAALWHWAFHVWNYFSRAHALVRCVHSSAGERLSVNQNQALHTFSSPSCLMHCGLSETVTSYHLTFPLRQIKGNLPWHVSETHCMFKLHVLVMIQRYDQDIVLSPTDVEKNPIFTFTGIKRTEATQIQHSILQGCIVASSAMLACKSVQIPSVPVPLGSWRFQRHYSRRVVWGYPPFFPLVYLQFETNPCIR